MPNPVFKRLNDGWNEEPNAPDPRVGVGGTQVRLRFLLNPFAHVAEVQEEGCLTFTACSLWRLGPTDNGEWSAGRCRFSQTAPAWGEFYELIGADDLRLLPGDWHRLIQPALRDRHFLFYLRDDTFECMSAECMSAGWKFDRGGVRS